LQFSCRATKGRRKWTERKETMMMAMIMAAARAMTVKLSYILNHKLAFLLDPIAAENMPPCKWLTIE